MSSGLREHVRTLGRALRRECPHCGKDGLYASWFRVAAACPSCGFSPARFDQGYSVGALALNTVVSETMAIGVVVLAILATWPEPPWERITYAGAVLAVALPFAFYPFSQSLFIAINYVVRVDDPEPELRS